MDIRDFRRYQQLALEGNFKAISCYDEEHSDLVVSYDFDKDEIKLYCAICAFTVRPGINLYEKIMERLREYDANSEQLQEST